MIQLKIDQPSFKIYIFEKTMDKDTPSSLRMILKIFD